MAETVTITMTRDHAKVVQDACEMPKCEVTNNG